MKKSLLALCLFGTALAGSQLVYAATQSVTANIAFDTALTFTKNSDIEFGTVQALTAETYTISTAGVVTAAGSGLILYGTPAAADIDIAGSTTQTIDISVTNLTANGSVSLANPTCDYNGGGSGTCALNGAAAPGAGKKILIGIDAVVPNTKAAGSTAAPTFDLVVVYS